MNKYAIKNIDVTPLLIADPPLLNFQGVHQPYTPRVLVRIETAGGEYGVGETYGDADILKYLRAFSEKVTELRVDQPQMLWQYASRYLSESEMQKLDPNLLSGKMARNATGVNTVHKVHNIAVSVFEVAFLDAMGKLSGLPVHSLLGGKVRDEVDFAAYLFWKFENHGSAEFPDDRWGEALDIEGLVEQARVFVEDYGFKSIKLKGGYHSPEYESEAIEELKRIYPDHPVRLDPNGIWSVEKSIEVAQRLADTVEYLEDPTDGRQAMAEVYRATGVDLATNMCVTSMDQIPEAVALESVQVILCDHHFWGGIRQVQHLSRICQAFGLGMSMHSNSHLGISLAAMLHTGAVAEGELLALDTHRPWQSEDVVTEPHTFVDGALIVPDAPGLGVVLDEDRVKEYHQRWVEMPEFHNRDDVQAMRRFVPDWEKPSVGRW